jgi:Asp-tRNA(Asn)/Glu-tRNA(Gln) amidotransferase A subunit family amidase
LPLEFKKYFMKLIVCCFLFLISVVVNAQSKMDSIKLIKQTAQMFDVDFSDAEADSMISNLASIKTVYKGMHAQDLPNNLAFPFGFNPAIGLKIKYPKKENIVWKLPLQTKLHANKNDLAFYTIPELAAFISTKKISSVELTTFFLNRLKKWSDTLQCTITITEALALQQAKQADDEIKQGKYRGILHGIPYGLKDLFAVKGYKTTWGSTPYKDQFIDNDAFVYEQLKKAGAVLCAKLSLGALANNNKWFGGETKNPWNLKQGSSGSSAGSASAVVAGLLPFAIGTETLGSIVSPSSRCGATGLRPTFGTVSRYGAMVLCWSLDKVGPICRSAEDAAIVYNFIHGTDGNDPSAVATNFSFNSQTDIKKLKVAYAENYFSRLDSSSAEQKALKVFREMGANITAINFPDSMMYPNNLVNVILNAESAAAFDELTRSNKDDLIERQDKNFWPNTFRSARMIPAVEYINANRLRTTLCQQMHDFMKNYDVLIVPSFAGRQLYITNLTGNPVVVMPIGFNKNGNPQSISLVGNLYNDAIILQVANAFQNKTQYHKKHPELFKN